MAPGTRFEPFFRNQINLPTEELLQESFQIEIAFECRRALERYQHVDIAVVAQLVTRRRTEERQALCTKPLADFLTMRVQLIPLV